jgi:acetolactate synthase-1/2/3 large subunit
MHPGQLCQAISKLLPDNSVVLADAGTHLAWMGHYLRLKQSQIFRKPGSFGPMAVHVHGAMGVKLAHPDRPVVVGCGDGCYLLSGFELLTAVQYDIPVVWVVFADGEFNIIKFYQMNAFHESALVSFNNPDYVGFAEACGAKGFRAETVEQFEDAFKRALALGKPALIEAVIDPDAVPPFITQI